VSITKRRVEQWQDRASAVAETLAEAEDLLNPYTAPLWRAEELLELAADERDPEERTALLDDAEVQLARLRRGREQVVQKLEALVRRAQKLPLP
jgi:hypothetical protein